MIERVERGEKQNWGACSNPWDKPACLCMSGKKRKQRDTDIELYNERKSLIIIFSAVERGKATLPSNRPILGSPDVNIG